MLPIDTQRTSPFDLVVALGYHDGPEEGMVHCGTCGREYRFKILQSRIEPDDETETRIFGLSPIPEGSLATFTAAMSRYQDARSPNWAPIWSFPTDEDRVRMDDLVDRIFAQAKPIELAVATPSWLSDEILAARFVSESDGAEGKDWFSTLGLLKAAVEG